MIRDLFCCQDSNGHQCLACLWTELGEAAPTQAVIFRRMQGKCKKPHEPAPQGLGLVTWRYLLEILSFYYLFLYLFTCLFIISSGSESQASDMLGK